MHYDIRGIGYKTFAKLCGYPDEDLANLLFDDVITDFLLSLGFENDNLEPLFSWLKTNKSKEELLEKIQVEYTHLFITAYPSIEAPIYKSYYFEKEIFGQSAEKILDIYEKYNLHVSDDVKEPADSLPLLLEFVFRLTEIENSYDDQITFVKNEILSWIENFAAKVDENAKIPFYPIIVNLMIKYLKNDVTQNETKLAGAEL